MATELRKVDSENVWRLLELCVRETGEFDEGEAIAVRKLGALRRTV